MKCYFITSNKNKFVEVSAILKGIDLERIEIDLPEIQEFDSKKLVKQKLKEAFLHKPGSNYIVEDTSFHMECLGGLPGPYIKVFEKRIGLDGLYNISEKLENDSATAITTVGFGVSSDNTKIFSGSIKGKIVRPKGGRGFGWDQIFIPQGFDVRFSQMSTTDKNKISMRRKAFEKLHEYLDTS